ncbi:MAG: hypothetical protein NTW60_01890 [Candidatus Wolfebacteria bacterium]|nr:hypothetical protein [Candidatus Wolfebacteria bacterium]
MESVPGKAPLRDSMESKKKIQAIMRGKGFSISGYEGSPADGDHVPGPGFCWGADGAGSLIRQRKTQSR